MVPSLQCEDDKRVACLMNNIYQREYFETLIPRSISRTIALALTISIDNRSPCRSSPRLPILLPFGLTSHYSFLARECQETPLLAARNSSLVRPRIIARVNGSFFSMLWLVHTKHDTLRARRLLYACLAIVCFLCQARGAEEMCHISHQNIPKFSIHCRTIF